MSVSVTHRTTPETDTVERRRRVEIAVHSGEMEGLGVTPATRADAEEYVDGRLTVQELRARVRARYGVR